MSLEVEKIEEVLKWLVSRATKVSSCALVTSEGLPVATSLVKDVEADTLAAMAALLSTSGDEASRELFEVGFNQLIVRNEKGVFALNRISEDFLFVAKIGKGARLGLLFFYLDKAVKKIKNLLIPPKK